VADKAAGKKARCRCGTAVPVPAALADADESLEDWVCAAFRDPRTSASPGRGPEPRPEPPSATPEPEPVPDYPSPAFSDDLPRKRRKRAPPNRRRTIAGVASIAYGSLAAVVLAVLGILNFPEDMFSSPVKVAAAVSIAVGGVLILRRHAYGPAWAALSCIFLVLLHISSVFLTIIYLANTGHSLRAHCYMGAFLVASAVPAAITTWCLREEIRRQEREKAEQE